MERMRRAVATAHGSDPSQVDLSASQRIAAVQQARALATDSAPRYVLDVFNTRVLPADDKDALAPAHTVELRGDEEASKTRDDVALLEHEFTLGSAYIHAAHLVWLAPAPQSTRSRGVPALVRARVFHVRSGRLVSDHALSESLPHCALGVDVAQQRVIGVSVALRSAFEWTCAAPSTIGTVGLSGTAEDAWSPAPMTAERYLHDTTTPLPLLNALDAAVQVLAQLDRLVREADTLDDSTSACYERCDDAALLAHTLSLSSRVAALCARNDVPPALSERVSYVLVVALRMLRLNVRVFRLDATLAQELAQRLRDLIRAPVHRTLREEAVALYCAAFELVHVGVADCASALIALLSEPDPAFAELRDGLCAHLAKLVHTGLVLDDVPLSYHGPHYSSYDSIFPVPLICLTPYYFRSVLSFSAC